MNIIDQSKYPNVNFGNNVRIFAENASISDGAIFGDNVFIEAKNVKVGLNTKIEYGTTIKGLNISMDTFSIGDNCLLGHTSQVLVPYFSMSDYSQIHNNSLCSGYKPLIIGYNCWVGQGAILNSFEDLTIGNNVRMGGCQIWTHVASGELLEGSNFHGSNPVIIEDNVWLMGFGQLVTPGVILRKGSVIMAGSVVTKSTEPYKTYSGTPAKDVSDKLPAWKPMSLKDKVELLKKFNSEFLQQYEKYNEHIHLLESNAIDYSKKIIELLSSKEPQIIIVDNIDLSNIKNTNHSIFDITNKEYIKKSTTIEIDFLRFNLGYRARFTPFK